MPSQPAIYISHGGGPCFWMPFPPPIGPNGFDGLKRYLAGLLATLPERPSAVLVVTAHWEAARPTISTAPAPGMLFDYYGFPEHTYSLSYPAPGAPALAARAATLLRAAGIESDADAGRGFDHGVFVPMLIVDPDATLPVLMVSLRDDLDAAWHIRFGTALAPLRDEGLLIVGSGSSHHNMRSFWSGDGRAAAAFDGWLNQSVVGTDAATRNALLANWQSAPCARESHPREEHLLPLMVCAGAARDDIGRLDFHDVIGGNAISGFRFGA